MLPNSGVEYFIKLKLNDNKIKEQINDKTFRKNNRVIIPSEDFKP